MPILFVHGVSSRIENGHDETWKKVRNNLKKFIAPIIAKDGKVDDVWIEEAYWGDDSVDFGDLRLSRPSEQQIKEFIDKKQSWLKRKIEEFNQSPNKKTLFLEYLKIAPKKLRDLSGYQVTRRFDPLRTELNKVTTLFLGDIFFYLSRRGEVNKPGAITKEVLSKLKEAQNNKLQRNNEPLIVLSHSMGGQLMYDIVSYYLPEMVKIPEYQDYRNIYIDFWVAAASQVGLFKEMKVFKEDENSESASIPVAFPSKHLGIWWNLWDCNDYLSFTVKPFVEDVFDDMYDSGKPATKAHSAHFNDPDFYRELAQHISTAETFEWKREVFMQETTT